MDQICFTMLWETCALGDIYPYYFGHVHANDESAVRKKYKNKDLTMATALEPTQWWRQIHITTNCPWGHGA